MPVSIFYLLIPSEGAGQKGIKDPLESMERNRATRASAAEAHPTCEQGRALQQDDQRDAGKLEAWRYMQVLLPALSESQCPNLSRIHDHQEEQEPCRAGSNAWGRDIRAAHPSHTSYRHGYEELGLRIGWREWDQRSIRRPQSLDVAFSHDSTQPHPNTGLVPIRLESSLRLYPTVNPQAAFNQSTHVEVKRTADRPRLKQPRLLSTTSRPLIAGMLVDSPGTVELELWAMKSMSHDCAREPYTYKIQCSGSRILDGRQFFASHHEEYAIFFRPSIAVSRIQSRIMVIRKATEWGMTHEIEIDSVSSSGWVLFITVLGIWEVIVMNALELPAHSSARLHNVRHRYTFSTPAITFTSRGMGDREVGRLRTCAKCYQQGSPTSDVHSPLSSHRGVPVSRILQNSRSTGSLLKDNTECVGEMRTFDMVQQVKSEGRCGTDAGCVLRPYRSPSTRSTRVSQSRTPQTNYTLIPERYSNRFGQESHIDACTPALHAWIPHEFCCGLITSPPLSEQASDIQEA
ncbi:hypothetical protein BKA70DRAFT_1241889 [Coprinopsis sp. MPI-PUGE-AT-0042]|nr:hypothetical protein BKA70DRAFT_1241889 [Coprinopsis sp. MPI-PUGE-AT-0042]